MGTGKLVILPQVNKGVALLKGRVLHKSKHLFKDGPESLQHSAHRGRQDKPCLRCPSLPRDTVAKHTITELQFTPHLGQENLTLWGEAGSLKKMTNIGQGKEKEKCPRQEGLT